MKHRAKVLENDFVVAEDEFDFLCDAVEYCNQNAHRGDKCLVVEVIRSLTGYEEYGTITSWDFSREYA